MQVFDWLNKYIKYIFVFDGLNDRSRFLWAIGKDFLSCKEIMEHLVKKSIFDLPDESIELIMEYLSFKDLFNLTKERNRLAECAKRVSKKKPFSKYNRSVILQQQFYVFKWF